MDNLNYGVIGNCCTAALISEKGNIEWLCFPNFDSPSIFAALLDREKGGTFGFEVSEDYHTIQSYVPHTNILSTTFVSEQDEFAVVDFMPCYELYDNKEYYRPAEVYRYIHWIKGRPRIKVNYHPAPDYGAGMSVDSVLFYRYALAIVVLGIMMKMQKQSFAIKKADVLPLCIMGLLFSFSSLFLFMSYNYMDAGIASTILFVYPVLVAIIMAVVFKEKVSPVTMFSIALAFVGISLLCKSPGGQTLSLVGITFVFLSSLSYAIYIVGVNRSSLKDMPIAKLTFYVLLFGLSVYVVRLKFCTGLQPIPTPLLWVNAVSLAVFPTVISLVTMTKAIHYIGSTPTAILGALEPVTALFFGVLIFGEQLTPRIILGILMVITAVTLIIGGKTLLKKSKIRLRHTGR